MNRKLFTIILAVVLIASFFLPIGTSGSTSAFDAVQAPSYGTGIENLLMKYLWLLVPVSGLMLLIGALNNGNYFLGRGLWGFLPLLAVAYLLVRPIIDGGADIGDMIKGFGVGMWMMLVGSLVLAIYHPKS